jgi:hypothetical protein
LLFRSDLSPPLAFQGEELGVALVGVVPAEVAMQPAGHHGVAGMVGVVQHELAQRAEVALDRLAHEP